MSRLHHYPQIWWIKSIFQGKCISRKLLQYRAAAAQHMAVPRHCCCPESRTCWGNISLPQQWVPTSGAASRQPLLNKRCRERGTCRRFLSPNCYHLAICYVLPTPLFLRLAEQKQPLIKIQNYKACLAERKQYLNHIWFWEGYNSHKSWLKLSSITLINCTQNRIEANIFQGMMKLKVHCSPTAFSFHCKKVDYCLLLF